MPFSAAHRLFILLHYPLAALFMDRFLQNRGLSRTAALIGGLAFALSGYLTAQHSNPVYLIGPAWAPLALHCFDWAFRDGLRWAVAAGMVIAVQVLGGDVQSAAITGALLSIIAASNLRERTRTALTALALLFLALSLGRHLPAYALVHRIAPLFDRFRYPEKFMAWFAGAMAVAAALGLDALTVELRERPRRVMAGAIAFMVAAATAVAVSALVWPSVIQALTGLPGDSRPFGEILEHLTKGGKQALMVCLAAGLAVAIGARTASRRTASPRLALRLLIAVMVIDWWFASVAIMPAGPPDVFDFPPQAAAAIKKDRAGKSGDFRIHRLAGPRRPFLPRLAGRSGRQAGRDPPRQHRGPGGAP